MRRRREAIAALYGADDGVFDGGVGQQPHHHHYK
jgi:hypothetical protein